MADLIIRDGYLVTMNARREIFPDGAVAIEGNRIVGVGPTSRIVEEFASPDVISAKGMLVLPGLIDAHNHPSSYLGTGMSDDLGSSVFERLYPYENALTPEDVYISSLGTFAEMIKSGTTCFNDPGGYDADSVGEAAKVAGMRGVLSRSLRDRSYTAAKFVVEDVDTSLREGEGIIERWQGACGGRIRAGLSLRNEIVVTDELCKAVKELADKHKVSIHTHIASVKNGNDRTLEAFGKRSLQRFYDLGLFSERLICAHAGFANEDEIELMKQHDVKVVHCASTSMLGGMGIIANGMIKKMVDAGITVAIGSDTADGGGYLDLVRVMYVAAAAHRDAYADRTIMGAYKALEMGTLEGAKVCLWEDEIGSLETGKLADVILVSQKEMEWAHPGRDPVRSFVYSSHGGSVDTVIIDGRIVMKERILTTIDEEDIRRQVGKAGTDILARIGVTAGSAWPVLN